MATLQKIRNLSGLLIVVIGVALLSFIVGDFLNSGSTFLQMSRNNVAKVNGTAISPEEFEQKLAQLGPNVTDADRNRLFQEMVMSMAAADCAEEIGISVSDEELMDLINGENVSQLVKERFTNPQTGVFDKEMLNGYLSQLFSMDQTTLTEEQQQQLVQLTEDWYQFEDAVKEDQINRKMFNLVSKSLLPNDVDLEASYAQTTKNVDIAYVPQLYSVIPDSTVSVSEKELKDLYSKKRENYKTQETRTIEFVALSVAPTQDDYKAAEEMFNNLSEEFATTEHVRNVQYVQLPNEYITVSTMSPKMKEFVSTAKKDEVSGTIFENNAYKKYRVMSKTVSPDSVEVRHIMFALNQEALCDSIYNVLKKGGNFTELAKEYSMDRAEEGGNMGWLTEPMLSQLGSKFADAAFRGEKGVQKVTTQFGLHLIEVTQKTKPVEKAQVAQLVVEVKASQATQAAIFDKVSKYVAERGESDTFSEGDIENGISVQTAKISKADINISYVPNAREIVRWAFSADENDISKIMDVNNKSFVVVAKLTKISDGEYEAFEDVEPLLKTRLTQEKKGEKVAELLKGYTTLEDAAQALGARVDTARSVVFRSSVVAGIGFEPKLAGAAPYAPVNEIQAPVQGSRAVYLYKVVKDNDLISTFNKESEKTIYTSAMSRYISQTYYELIYNLTEIDDNRTLMY
ncbi:MAG: SurA N-terminal domain-containing protein [Bacteroidales bacterium]|nr:SurA N-terminal domain-containing protein [Bacteroidales bacterium]